MGRELVEADVQMLRIIPLVVAGKNLPGHGSVFCLFLGCGDTLGCKRCLRFRSVLDEPAIADVVCTRLGKFDHVFTSVFFGGTLMGYYKV